MFKYEILLYACCFSISLSAQTAISSRIKTEIVSPLIVEETQQLGFGKFISKTAGGTIQLLVLGGRDIGNVKSIDSPFSVGKFLITGSPGTLVSIALPQQPVVVRLESGNCTMKVALFTSDVPVGGRLISQSDGQTDINIEARLFVEPQLGNPIGVYTGTYDIVFMYN